MASAVTEFSGNTRFSASGDLGPWEVAAPLRVMEGRGEGYWWHEKVGLGAALCTLPAGSVPMKARVRSCGHLQTVVSLASHFVTVKTGPFPGPQFSSFRVKKSVFGLSQAPHSK